MNSDKKEQLEQELAKSHEEIKVLKPKACRTKLENRPMRKLQQFT